MSQENVELIREATDAVNRDDLDAFVALLSPDVVWEVNPDLPGLRDVYRGRAEVRELIEELSELAESHHTAHEEIMDLRDGRVFTEYLLTVRGGAAACRLRSVTGRCFRSRRARSQVVRYSWKETKPSKPPGLRSRR